VVTDQFGDAMYYDNKMEAKLHRDRLGGRTVVSFGPDHKDYVG